MEPTHSTAWPIWRKFLFCCSCILFTLIAAPWDWLLGIPLLQAPAEVIDQGIDWLVNAMNSMVLHVKPVLVPLNGSGDTSFGWAALWTYLLVAGAGGLIWTVLDRKRRSYTALNYWLCILLRYYLAFVCFQYGIAKLFLTQMPFPNNSELATPLGDFLPMRLSWMFFGYSAPYQFFSGAMECIAGLLLIWRRTATLGTLFAAGVFLNVAVLNLSFDIPVKIFSIEMLAICLFLLINEGRRLACFFLLNRPADSCSIYAYQLPKKWMRRARIGLKVAFLLLAIGLVTYDTHETYAMYHQPSIEVIPPGLYDVTDFRRNGQLVTDSTRWENIALDGRREATLKGVEPALPLTYGRRLFMYDVDADAGTFDIANPRTDSVVGTLRYLQRDSLHIEIWGTYGGDSLELKLVRSGHKFQLAERQFHWLSERNR